MSLSNFEKWKAYTADLPSPDNYIQWGWLFMISAALQRRVWMPPSHNKLYMAMYPILVGEAGIGKGGVIERVQSILSRFTLEDFGRNGATDKLSLTQDERLAWKSIHENQLKEAQNAHDSYSTKQQMVSKAPLLPSGGDSITYERLVQKMAQSLRYVPCRLFDEKEQKYKMGIYGHCSMYICLEDIASMFKKHTENLMIFLTQAYDCKEEYLYEIKSGKPDRIRKFCLHLFGGAVPEFIQSIFDDRLVNSGFASRVFFIFALKNRFPQFFRPEHTPEQKQCGDDIVNHVLKLTHLYGQIILEQQTVEFLEEWKRQDYLDPSKRASQSSKLQFYYSRKNIHIMKVAAALHFGESTSLEIPHETFLRAIEILHEEEKTMALALMVGDKNPLAKPSKKITDFLRANGPRTFNNLLTEFWSDLKEDELEEVLNFLQKTEKIGFFQKTDELTQKTNIMYKVI